MPSLQPKKLSGRHRLILRMYCAGKGSSAIAESVGMSPTRVSVIINSDKFQAEYRRMTMEIDSIFARDEVDEVLRDPVRQRLAEERLNNIQTLINLRDTAKKDEVRAKCAMDMLDRDGYKVPVEHNVTSKVVITDESARNLDLAAKDLIGTTFADSINDNIISSGGTDGE